jgi:hypothetical protein
VRGLRLLKQFCGLATSAVLAQEGFVPTRLGVHVRGDPVFATGAVYAKRIENEPKSSENLLKRMIDTQMRWASSYLAQRIDALDSLPPRMERSPETKLRRKRPKKDDSHGL